MSKGLLNRDLKMIFCVCDSMAITVIYLIVVLPSVRGTGASFERNH